jgi:outer membrane protein, heavy metal efflux system
MFAAAVAPTHAPAQRAPLSLADARAQAVATHPELAAARADAEAAANRARQRSLLEPPELELEFGPEGLFEGVEAGVKYLTPIRSGRKTRVVRELVALEAQRARLAVAVAEAALDLEVTRAFLVAAVLAERVRIDREDSGAVAALVENARRRRALGFATDLDVLRLEAEESAARRRLIAAAGAKTAAIAELSSLLGRTLPEDQAFVFDRAAVADDTTALALVRLQGDLVSTAASVSVQQARPALALARLSRFTDPRIGGGYAYELGEHSLTAVLRVPLPVRARNRHAIGAAELELRAAELRVTATRRRSAAVLQGLRVRRAASAEQLRLLRDDLERRRLAEALARRRLEEGGPYLQIWLDIRRGRIALEREELELLLALTTAGAAASEDADRAAALPALPPPEAGAP